MILRLPDNINGNGNGNGSPVKTTKSLESLKIEMPKEPPKEVKDMTFSMEGLPTLDNSEGGPIVSSTEKKDNKTVEVEDKTKVVESKEVKVEDKKEGKKDDALKITSVLKPPTPAAEKKDEKVVEKKDEKKEVIKQITPPVKGDFDFTGYSPEETSHLKNMSKEARTFTGKLIKDNKELSKLKDSNYLQHPDAYQLSPEFREMQMNVNKASFEAKYWGEQLALCKLGKPIRDLTGYDNKGNPIYGQEMKPTDEMEEQIRTIMQNDYALVNNLRGKLQEYPVKFQKQIGIDQQAIEQECQKRFAWESDPKLMDYTVNIEGAGEKSLKQVRQDFLSLFPTYMHNSIALRVATNMMIAMVIQKAELDEAKSGRQVADTKVEEVKRTEPTSIVKPGKEPETINGVREFSVRDMPSF